MRHVQLIIDSTKGSIATFVVHLDPALSLQGKKGVFAEVKRVAPEFSDLVLAKEPSSDERAEKLTHLRDGQGGLYGA